MSLISLKNSRLRSFVKVFAVALALALPVALAVSSADAGAGRGSSSGSRGSRTFSAPPSTKTAPNAAQPMQRTITQPGSPSAGSSIANQGARGGMFGGLMNRPGLLGGLAAGFLGAGLLGLLFGHGFAGGLAGMGSFLGLIIQIVLIVIVARLIWNWWQRRNAPALAGPAQGMNPRDMMGQERSGLGMGHGSGSEALDITENDYLEFERLLGSIQDAWSNEDIGALRGLATPEMVSYFSEDLTANSSRGVVNKVTGVKLLQGDLAEAWREGDTDYATVAMRFSLTDVTVERASGRVVDGSEQPTEATEVWTFRRDRGGRWMLSAIQQV
jgi:predicted lipid-binding transport protein (Tim44 family)